MTAIQETVLSTDATVHTVAFTPEAAIPILDATEATNFALRNYPTVERLFESTTPNSTGCVIVHLDHNESKHADAVARIKAYFFSMPVVVVRNADSADDVVLLMQQGAHSVLPHPVEHATLVATMTGAIEESVQNQSTVDLCRDASLRMQQATEKELEVLTLIMDGKKNKEIAVNLGITVRAVEDRRFRLMKKVSADSVAELVALAVSARYFDQGFSTSGLRRTAAPDTHRGVKGLEVWIPSDDETHLMLSQSCYRDAMEFHKASEGLVLRRGEGLPGRIWESGAPGFLKELITNDFVRRRAAGAAGMTTAVGFPVFCEERLQSVVMILLDSRHQMKAAFESWRLDPESSALRLSGGTYMNCEKLRRLSGFISLPVGEGLPGFAAEQARPLIGSRFNDERHAVRGIALAAEQLISGLALPLTDSGAAVGDVFLLFNSETTPIFSLLQIWKPNGTGTGVQLSTEYRDGVSSLSNQLSRVPEAVSENIAGQCWQQRMPVIADDGEWNKISQSAAGAVPTFGIAIPTLVAGKVVAVTVLAS